MDFPQPQITPLLISTWSTLYTGFREISYTGFGNFAGASVNWPQANRAIFVPLKLPWPYHVKRVFWGNGSGSLGNADFGIYSIGGGKIYSAGITGQSGNSALQYVSADFVLPPGRYLMAAWYSGTTNVAYGSTNAGSTVAQRFAGCYQQSSLSSGLPAAATFAAFATAIYPLCGITRTTTGF